MWLVFVEPYVFKNQRMFARWLHLLTVPPEDRHTRSTTASLARGFRVTESGGCIFLGTIENFVFVKSFPYGISG